MDLGHRHVAGNPNLLSFDTDPEGCFRNPLDIDHHLGRKRAVAQPDDQVGAAGQNLCVRAVLRQEGNRLRKVSRQDVAKRSQSRDS